MAEFEIGDDVKLVREDMAGKVTGFAPDGQILVEMEGFDMAYPAKELVHARPRPAQQKDNGTASEPSTSTVRPPTVHQEDAPQSAPKSPEPAPETPPSSAQTEPAASHSAPVSDDTHEAATEASKPTNANKPTEASKPVDPPKRKLTFVSSGLQAQENLDSGFYLMIAGGIDTPYELSLKSLVSTPQYVVLYEDNRLEAHGMLKTGQSLHLKSTSALLGKRDYYLHTLPLHESLEDTRQLHYTHTMQPADFEAETIPYGLDQTPTRFIKFEPGRPEPSFKPRKRAQKGQRKRKIRRVRPAFLKEARAFNLEIDLHLEALLKPGERVASKDALDYQLTAASKAMEEALEAGVSNLTFIHGIGGGRLKEALIDHLRMKHGDNLKQMYLGGRYSDNPGALYVELEG